MNAHSKNTQGKWHGLVEHLESVAQFASKFADKFGAAEMGYWAGLWHDAGKAHPDFQKHLNDPRHKAEHKGAGALMAQHCSDYLVFLISGHHGGLFAKSDMQSWVREKNKSPVTQEAIRLARERLQVLQNPPKLPPPANIRSKFDAEFFIRMLFSALVDADFLDTERHFESEKSALRSMAPSLQQLWIRFESDQKRLTGKHQDAVNRIRHEVFLECLRAAELSPGFFRLTVPTGGGKTRSSMAFALRHALLHGLHRVIVAIPYTSIIEQNAQVFRQIFGDEAVLEHHSALNPEEPEEEGADGRSWTRLASENWDAPIVVTTTVQLFESLFANSTSRCRKLHNIARSVLILDEVQTLPERLLTPILDVLKQLTVHYGVSVVFCTATQPAFTNRLHQDGLENVREIVSDPARLFQQLQRVSYDIPESGQKWNWERAAAEMRTSPQALAVVNTKADAIALLDALHDPQAMHLSTLLCGAHRRRVIQCVNEKLKQGAPCHLVSTQVVEAGVDMDFPLVLRAVGPLDRMVQAAGRCNREGLLPMGRAVIFDPVEGGLPKGAYASGTSTACSLMQTPGFDFHDPKIYEKYFRRLYQAVDLDALKIQEFRQSFDYPEVAARFRLIEDDTVPVVVRYRGADGKDDTVDHLISYASNIKENSPRWLLRKLQPYLVNIRSYYLAEFHKSGMIHELFPGLWEWLGGYDDVRGLIAGPRDPADLVV